MSDDFLSEQMKGMFGPGSRRESNIELACVDNFVALGLPRSMVQAASDAGEIRYQGIRQQIYELMISDNHERNLEAAMLVAATLDWFEELLPMFQVLVHAMGAIHADKEAPKSAI